MAQYKKPRNMKADLGLVLGIILAALVIYVLTNPGAATPSLISDLSPKIMSAKPSIEIISPIEGEELKSHDVTVTFEVKNMKNGNYIHLQIDGGCGEYEKSGFECMAPLNYLNIPQTLKGPQIVRTSTDPVTFKLVKEGKHTIKVFLVDSNHIPIGTNGEMDEVTFTVNVVSAKNVYALY